MKNDLKIIIALLDLLSEGKAVNKHSICKRADLHRFTLDRRIRKNNQFIDVEIIK